MAAIGGWLATAQAAPAADPVTKAAALEKAGDWPGMIELLRPGSDGLSRRGLLMLGRAYGARKDRLNQVRALEMAVNKFDHDYFALTALGEAYLAKADSDDPVTRTKDQETAADSFRESIDANKAYGPAYEGLLTALERLGDRFEARSLVTDMIGKFGAKPRFQALLCRLYSADSFLDKAIEVCRGAIEAEPKNPDNHVYLGLSTLEKERSAQEEKTLGKDAAQAEKILNKAAKQFPTSELAQWAAGTVAFERKNYLGSYRLYVQGTKADPTSVRSWQGAARAAMEAATWPEALDAFTNACELDSQTLGEFRRAGAVLRQRKLEDWGSKFDARLPRCGARQASGLKPGRRG